jgi:hypothetical protein
MNFRPHYSTCISMLPTVGIRFALVGKLLLYNLQRGRAAITLVHMSWSNMWSRVSRASLLTNQSTNRSYPSQSIAKTFNRTIIYSAWAWCRGLVPLDGDRFWVDRRGFALNDWIRTEAELLWLVGDFVVVLHRIGPRPTYKYLIVLSHCD